MESFNIIEKKAEIYKNIKKVFNSNKDDNDNKNDIDIVIGNLVFGGNIPIIFVKFRDNNKLAECWQDFNNFTTAEYLLPLKDEFSKWNAYLFYLADRNVPKSLKYEIENNKFSTRKMVIDFTDKTFDENTLEDILSKYILNEGINYNVRQQNIEPFTKDAIINNALNNESSKKEDNELNILNYLAKEL